MKQIDNGFGYIEIKPVVVREKDSLIVLSCKATRKVRLGIPKSGRYKDKIVMYQAHTEVVREYMGKEYIFIPANACFAVYELGDNEYLDDPIYVNENVGKDMHWYGSM